MQVYANFLLVYKKSVFNTLLHHIFFFTKFFKIKLNYAQISRVKYPTAPNLYVQTNELSIFNRNVEKFKSFISHYNYQIY